MMQLRQNILPLPYNTTRLICSYPVSANKILYGDGNLSYQQMSQMSIQALQAIIASHQQRINEIDQAIARDLEFDPPYRMDESTKQMLLTEKVNLLARIAAIQAWLNLSVNQRAHTNGENFIRTQTNQYLASYQNSINYLNTPPNVFENITDSVTGLLNTDIAGFPAWSVLLFGGAAVWLLFGKNGNSKK